MISVIQRVNRAAVKIDNSFFSEINKGLLVLLGVSKDDTFEDIKWSAEKILNMRIFSNEEGKFDYSVKDINGELLIVSQFTLLGNVKKGRRPDFTGAMQPEKAEEFYNIFVDEIKKNYIKEKVKTGKFAAEMIVEIENNGPVTIIVDSKIR